MQAIKRAPRASAAETPGPAVRKKSHCVPEEASAAEAREERNGAAVPDTSCSPARGRKIRVLVADDHEMMREGLAVLLRREPDIELVGGAFDGEVAVELARELRPDVVVMDVTMPRVNGIEATRRIVAELAGVSVIGLSMHEEADMAAAMREAGASGYLTKDGPPDALVAAIRACHSRCERR